MKITHYFIKTLAILGLASSGALAQSELFPNANQKWVDSVFKTLTVDQKIGQLMMPRANYNATYDTTRLNQIVRDYHVGGLVFFAGNPSKQAVLVNKLQAMAKVPMLIGMDLEWGLSMRLDSTTRFPYQMALVQCKAIPSYSKKWVIKLHFSVSV
jgi:hypothetical protein